MGNPEKNNPYSSGQIIIFHQPRFPWNKGMSLPQLHFGVRSCEVAIIWPDTCAVFDPPQTGNLYNDPCFFLAKFESPSFCLGVFCSEQNGPTCHFVLTYWIPRDPGSPCQRMIGVSNHLLSKAFRFHYHSQKVDWIPRGSLDCPFLS